MKASANGGIVYFKKIKIACFPVGYKLAIKNAIKLCKLNDFLPVLEQAPSSKYIY